MLDFWCFFGVFFPPKGGKHVYSLLNGLSGTSGQISIIEQTCFNFPLSKQIMNYFKLSKQQNSITLVAKIFCSIRDLWNTALMCMKLEIGISNTALRPHEEQDPLGHTLSCCLKPQKIITLRSVTWWSFFWHLVADCGLLKFKYKWHYLICD